MNILVIDNYDSFTYNLVHYLEDLDCAVTVKRNDQLTIEEVADYDKIVLSPGPGIPDEAGLLKPIISAYADAAFANETGRRSRYGFIILLAGCAVSWCTKTSTMVCLSTAEAEYVAATEATKDVLWFRGMLAELGFEDSSPSMVHEDNQACVAMIRNHIVSGRNRHFCVKMA